MNYISMGLDTGMKLLDGNYSGAAINAATFGLGALGKKGINALNVRGIGSDILKGGVGIKTDGINRGVMYQIRSY